MYDNAENWEIIKSYWPLCAQGSIVLTSQHSKLAQLSGGSQIALQPLHHSHGAKLLLRYLGRNADEVSFQDISEAESISDVVGGLPMAISHMAGYIDTTKISLTEFNEIYQRRKLSNRIWRQNCRAWTYQYPGSLDTLWDIALQQLSGEARSLIYKLSMLSPDRIPENMLFNNFKGETLSIW